MTDPLTGNTIVFNGEIYNFQALRAACEEKGDTFLSQTDTEVIYSVPTAWDGLFCICAMFARNMTSNQHLFRLGDMMGKKPQPYLLPDGMMFI
jgi:asparagine synthase (glutamine-hydrolysing)